MKNFVEINRASTGAKKKFNFKSFFSPIGQKTDCRRAGKNEEKSKTTRKRLENDSKTIQYVKRALRYAAIVTLLLTLACGNAWGATTAPSGLHNQSSLNYAATDIIQKGGKIYEIYWCNSNSSNVRTALSKKTYGSSNTEATGTDKWCNIGSSVGNTSASATAGTIDEFTWSTSHRYMRVRASNQSNYQVVMVVKGYEGVAVLHKANTDLQIVVERYNTATSAYVAYTPATSSTSKATNSHYKTYASLDKSDQFRITFQGSGTGSTNRDMLAFSLSVTASSCSATANAGADKSTTVGVGVAMAATAASSGYTGAWSIKAGSPSTATSQLSSTSSPTATFTPTAAGTYTLVWTVTDNSDGTCSASDEATVTVTAPTHTVTATTDNASYGTAAAASGTVMEGLTTTITATPNSGYAFDHWTVSGTGATLSSTSTNPTTLTMGTADATVTAYFAESCDVQVFSLTDEIGSAVVTASDATVTAGTSLVMSNTAGRIRLTPASGKFKNGDKVEFGGTIGNTSKNYGIKIYASDGTTSAGNIYVAGTTSPLKASGTLSLASDQDYIFIARYDGTTTTLTSCEITRVSPCPEPPSCTAPTTTFGNGEYTVGGSALDLSTLIGSNNSSGAITYTVKNANGTGASISTASFTATTAGTCTVTATQAANGDKCEKVMDATITVNATPSISSFSPASGSTIKSGTTITVSGSSSSTVYCLWASSTPSASDVKGGTAGTSGAAAVTSAGIASANGTTLYAVATRGGATSSISSASYTIDDTAPTLSSSNPANGATGVATSGTIVLTFSEEIANVDGSKFTLTGATIGAVAKDGSDATKVNIAYSGASNSTTVTLATAAGAVSDAAGNTSAALSSISFTTEAAATYTVTYNGSSPDGGSVPEDANSPYSSGATVTVLGNTGNLTKAFEPEPSELVPATFIGWNTNSNTYGGTHYDEDDQFTISGNTTLYAVWGYPIAYDADGGTINDASYPSYYICTYPDDDATTTLPSDVTKTGYDFDGWYTSNGSGSKVTAISGGYTGAFTGDYALKAKWTANSYTITLNKGDHGAANQSASVLYDATELTSITHVAATGYDRTGYFDGSTKVLNADGSFADDDITGYITDGKWSKTADASLTAKWSAQTYTISYKDQGDNTYSGSNGGSLPTSHTYGSATDFVNGVKSGYRFMGWYTDASCTVSAGSSIGATAITANTTYYAKWAQLYTITNGEPSNGTITVVTEAIEGETVSITASPNSEYNFDAWSVYKTGDPETTITPAAATASTSFTMPAYGVTVDATFVVKTYSVTYNGNGRTGGSAVPTDATAYTSGQTVTVKAGSGMARTYYTFMGWLNEATNTFYKDGQTFTITANTTLKAQWNPADGCETTLVDINFTNKGSSTAYSAGTTYTLDGTSVYFKSAMSTYSDGTYLNLPGNASTSSNYIAVPLAGINGEITITVTHNSIRPQWKHYFNGLNSAATASNLSTQPSSMSDNTRPGSNTTTSTWTLSSNSKSYGVFYIGKGNNGTRQFMRLTITTPCSAIAKTITFNKGTQTGATGMPANYSVPSGSKIIEPTEIPTVSNYIFDGWVTTGGGSTPFDFSTTISSNTTIFASWRAKTAPEQYTFSLSEPCASASPSATLSGSQSGWSYQLYKDDVASGDPKSGTGSALTWTSLAAGTYLVKTVETSTQASAQIGSSATVYAGTSITSDLASSRAVNANVSTTVSFVASGASLSYQWYTCNSDGTGKVAVGTNSPQFTNTFTNDDAPTKYICCVATGTCGTVTSNIQTVTINRTYYLTVDLDGGSWAGGISSGYRTVSTFNIPTPIPTKSGYVFLGWSFLGNTYQPGAAITPNQTATLRALWASPCFSVSDASKKTMPDGQPSGTVITSGGMINGTISGGTLTYTGIGGATLNGNAKGLIFNEDNDELTVSVSGAMLTAGTVIQIEAYGTASTDSHTNGFKIGSNSMTPNSVTSTTSNNAITQRYIVKTGDGVINGSSFTIKRVAGTDQVMLNMIYVGGCGSCTTISPTLTYSATTLYAFGGTPGTATPTLNKDGNTGAVTWTSSNTDAVTVDASGNITAVGAGSATITAELTYDGVHCGGIASCDITVPALVTQTINVGNSDAAVAWGTPPNMTFNDPTSTLTQNAVIDVIGYTFNKETTYKGQRDGRYMTADIKAANGDRSDSKYLSLSFNCPSHNIRVGEVIFAIQPITNSLVAKASISDGTTTVMSAESDSILANSTVHDVKFTFTPTTLKAGTITVKIYVYGQPANKGFRLANTIYVNGAVLTDYYATATGNWSSTSTWEYGVLPLADDNVILQKPVTVDNTSAVAKNVVIDKSGGNTGKLTIAADGMLIAAGTIRANGDAQTAVEDVIINTDASNQGALIFDNPAGSKQTKGTVNFYTRSYRDNTSKKLQWQYVGVPFDDVTDEVYGGLYVNKYSETAGSWTVMRYQGDRSISAWDGLALAGDEEGYAPISGTFTSTEDKDITLTHSAAAGENLVGNSWTAPIQIADLEASDFRAATATVYIFNTGRYKESEGSGSIDTEGTTGHTKGQWMTIPIASAATGEWEGMKVIPAFQGFEVITSAETTLSLDYSKVVASATNAQNAELHAPARRTNTSGVDGYRIRVSDEQTRTDMYLFEHNTFSEGFDNGWDGDYMPCDGRSAQLYAQTALGKLAVAALPDLEGTVLGFKPGKSTEYTFSFGKTAGNYYLNDLKMQESTLIQEGNTYTFNWEDGDSTNRFIISASPYKMPTGVEEMENGKWKMENAKKVLIDDHLYIIRAGEIFNATGSRVK